MATDMNGPANMDAPYNAYQGAEKLLKLAEQLDEKCQERDRSIAFRWFAIVTALAAALSGIVVVWQAEGMPPIFKWFFLPVGFVYGVALVGLALLTLRRMYRQVQKDRRALNEIVDMLREVERAVFGKDNVSALERAEFRIRLSRFDIGPDYYRPHKRRL